jgi:DNA polymerase III alpha subunit
MHGLPIKQLIKANYPAEYMAAVLSNNMSDIKQVSLWRNVSEWDLKY